MTRLPSITKRLPVLDFGVVVRRLALLSKECRARLAKVEVLKPDPVDGLDPEPEDDLHGRERDERKQKKPETRAYRRSPEQQKNGDDGKRLGDSAECEARIVDRLGGQIGFPVQAELSGKLERMRQAERHHHCREQDRNDFIIRIATVEQGYSF